MTTDLSRETAVERDWTGVWRGALSEDWQIWGPMGGVVSGLALRAVLGEAEHEDLAPVSVYTRFVDQVHPGTVEVQPRWTKRSRRVSYASAELRQDGQVRLTTDLVLARGLRERAAHERGAPPRGDDWFDVRQALPPDSSHPMIRYPFFQRLELWQIPSTRERETFDLRVRFLEPQRFATPGERATCLLALLDSCMYPASTMPHTEHTEGTFHPLDSGFAAPSLDLCVHVHRLDWEGEWFSLSATSRHAGGGVVHGDARVWDEAGRLLGSATQQLYAMPARAAREP
jgi:acyl-CoA thioesterase